LYDQGLGVTQNYSEAAKWYRLAADQGYPQAQYNLGLLYNQGNGVAKDNNEAKKWWQKASDQGLSAATFALKTLPQ
jgi:TPR repeat protein